MEYHFSEHINNIHDIFLHGALNLPVSVLSGQVRNHKKSNNTHTRRNKQKKWCEEEVKGEKTDYLQN